MKRTLQLFTVMAFVFALSFSAWADAYLITSAGDPALSGGQVVSFDSEAGGTYYNFTSGGVVFQSLDDIQFRISADYSGQYGATGVSFQNGAAGTALTSSIRISGAGGGTTNAFAFNWGAPKSTWKLSAYGASGNLLASYTLSPTGSSGGYYGVAAEGISYAELELIESSEPEVVVLDNFITGDTSQSQAAAVPEPTTMLLLGIGLVGAAAARKRFHK